MQTAQMLGQLESQPIISPLNYVDWIIVGQKGTGRHQEQGRNTKVFFTGKSWEQKGTSRHQEKGHNQKEIPTPKTEAAKTN